MTRAHDLVGKRFGKLTAEKVVGSQPGSGGRLWRCRCDCGAEKLVLSFNLMGGHVTKCSRSCGRQSGERTPEAVLRQTWRDMRRRCGDPRHPKFPDYGGRGISIDPRWAAFETFAKDMGLRPSKPGVRYSIERKDNEGPYSPENCQWLVVEKQARNKRNTHLMEAGGLTLNVTEWAVHLGVCTRTIRRWAKEGRLEEAARGKGTRR